VKGGVYRGKRKSFNGMDSMDSMVNCIECNEYFDKAYGLTGKDDKIICQICGVKLDGIEFMEKDYD
tara:strand:+ start:1751 stop:1948 length:198 start_codon:yes stop_codon:yes gene_type:complete